MEWVDNNTTIFKVRYSAKLKLKNIILDLVNYFLFLESERNCCSGGKGATVKPFQHFDTTNLSVKLLPCHLLKRFVSKLRIFLLNIGHNYENGEPLGSRHPAYKAMGRTVINYTTPGWRQNIPHTNYSSIQYAHNEAMRIATGCHKTSSISITTMEPPK